MTVIWDQRLEMCTEVQFKLFELLCFCTYMYYMWRFLLLFFLPFHWVVQLICTNMYLYCYSNRAIVYLTNNNLCITLQYICRQHHELEHRILIITPGVTAYCHSRRAQDVVMTAYWRRFGVINDVITAWWARWARALIAFLNTKGIWSV